MPPQIAPLPVSAFISHSTVNLKIAKTIRNKIADYGVKAFVAHRDIEPSQEWQKRIMDELERTPVFIPLLTKDFRNSYWTDQEAGLAMARKALVIPIKMDYDPYGFMGRYQGLHFPGVVNDRLILTIARIIGNDATLGPSLRYWLMDIFRQSDSFDEADKRAERLVSVGGFIQKELTQILRVSCKNGQIYQSFGARRHINTLIDNATRPHRPSNRLVGEWRKRSKS